MMSKRSAVAISVALATVASSSLASVAAQQPPPRGRDATCADVANAPDKYVGKQIVFFGSVLRSSNSLDPKSEQVWACKISSVGPKGSTFTRVPSVSFTLRQSGATWTPLATKANKETAVFVVSGTIALAFQAVDSS